MEDYIKTEQTDGILQIRLNRPDKKNALTSAMYQTMADILQGAGQDSTIRVAILTGTGDCFTSGNDLHDFLKTGLSGGDPNERPVIRFLMQIATFPKPLIGAVNGAAIGIGVTMLLHCDLVYATEDAGFQLPFVNLALVPEAASSLLMPRLAGYHKAAELLMLGETFTAHHAMTCGLVNGIFPPDTLMDNVFAIAKKLSAKPPEALRRTKALMKADQANILLTIENETRVFAEQLQSPEAREAMQAFLEKRPPDFTRL